MIRVQCPSCGLAFDFADYLAGLTAICKNCTQRIPVPASSKSMESGKEAVQQTPTPVSGQRLLDQPASTSDAIQPTPGVTQTPQMPAFMEKFPEAPSIRKTSTTPPPEWAVERVRAMLALNQPIPSIVERLVAKGLSAEDASTAVDLVLEDRVQRTMAPIRRRDRTNKLHRILSVAVAALTGIFASSSGDGYYASWVCLRMAIPLTCIWFMNSGSVRAFFVRWAAWLFLIVLAARTVWWEVAFGQ